MTACRPSLLLRIDEGIDRHLRAIAPAAYFWFDRTQVPSIACEPVSIRYRDSQLWSPFQGGKVHTRGSTLYRARRIPEHTMQIQASLVVMIDLCERYGERVDRHWTRIASALVHLERDIRSSCAAAPGRRDVASPRVASCFLAGARATPSQPPLPPALAPAFYAPKGESRRSSRCALAL